MPKNQNSHLKYHITIFPKEFLEKIRMKAKQEDENISSLIRKVMADYVGWDGPTRNIVNYKPKKINIDYRII